MRVIRFAIATLLLVGSPAWGADWWVQRNGGGTIIGLYANEQSYAHELRSDGNADVAAFLNPPGKQAKALLDAGLTVQSSGTPSLNGLYSLDQTSQDQGWNIALGVGSGLGFPGGGSSFSYPDATGTPHDFDETSFVNLAKAIRDYVYGIRTTQAVKEAGGSADWPSATVTIP